MAPEWSHKPHTRVRFSPPQPKFAVVGERSPRHPVTVKTAGSNPASRAKRHWYIGLVPWASNPEKPVRFRRAAPFSQVYFSGRMPLLQRGGRWFKSIHLHQIMVSVAQQVERRIVAPVAVGSIPTVYPKFCGSVAQTVERRPEKACVEGSIPSLATTGLSFNGRTSVLQTDNESSILSSSTILCRHSSAERAGVS